MKRTIVQLPEEMFETLRKMSYESEESISALVRAAITEYLKNKEESPMKYEKSDFEEMVRDWRADNAPEYDDLEITEIEKEGRQWIAYAQDEKTAYTLTDDGQGNIIINYSGTR